MDFRQELALVEALTSKIVELQQENADLKNELEYIKRYTTTENTDDGEELY